MKTIRKFKMFDADEHIAVAVSGGKDSLSLLFILNKLFRKRRSFTLSSILINEGIQGYRDQTQKRAEQFCALHHIPLHIYSFKDRFEHSLDEILALLKSHPCTECGILRRSLINRAAREIHVSKLATGHNLDDEAQAILMNQMRKNIALQARLGPKTGSSSSEKFIPRIKPFYLIPEKEIALYGYLNGLYTEFESCPYEQQSFRAIVRDTLNTLEEKNPGIKNNIISSFLEILPLLQKKYKGKVIPSCKECGEPSASEQCSVCKLLEKIEIQEQIRKKEITTPAFVE